MTPSIVVFTWLVALPLESGGDLELPHFNRGEMCSFTEGDGGGDITYPSRCPRLPGAAGVICFPNGGSFSVNLQLSMKPGNEAEGVVLMESTAPPPRWELGIAAYGNSQFLLLWKSSQENFTLQGNTVILKAEENECFRLKYSSTGKAEINTDPRASRLTIHKLR